MRKWLKEKQKKHIKYFPVHRISFHYFSNYSCFLHYGWIVQLIWVEKCFILWKGTVSAQFRENQSKLCGNCVFPQNLHPRSLGEITVFSTVIVTELTFPSNFSKLRIYYHIMILKHRSSTWLIILLLIFLRQIKLEGNSWTEIWKIDSLRIASLARLFGNSMKWVILDNADFLSRFCTHIINMSIKIQFFISHYP